MGGGIFTPWTEFDWGGTDGGGLNSGGGGFFGDASGSRGSPPSVATLESDKTFLVANFCLTFLKLFVKITMTT